MKKFNITYGKNWNTGMNSMATFELAEEIALEMKTHLPVLAKIYPPVDSHR